LFQVEDVRHQLPAPTVVQFGCAVGVNVNSFATITVTGVTGGSGTYLNYEFLKNGVRVQFSASNVYTEANLAGGTNYTVNVFDNKGCIGSYSTPIVINPYIKLDKINIAVTTPITCSNNEIITVSVATSGGTPANLEYTVEDYNAATGIYGGVYPKRTQLNNGLFTDLVIGDYLVTVKNLDTNCIIQRYHYVLNPNNFQLNAVKTNEFICYGTTSGSVELTLIDNNLADGVDNASLGFDYVLKDSLNNIVGNGTTSNPVAFPLTGLSAGVYSVTATSKGTPYCSVTTSFTILQPATKLTIKENHTEITCVATDSGTISVSATGGWSGGYEYQLSGQANVAYSTNSVFNNLSAGNYTVSVRDSKGCIDSVSLTLNNPTPITFTATPSTNAVSCYGYKTASIAVTAVAGGQGSNYLYTLNTTSANPVISSGPQSSNVFTDLGAGTYTITVTDGWGCSTTSTAMVITAPKEIVASLVKASSQTCTTLSTLTLSVTGGTAPYSYSATSNLAGAILMAGSSVTFPVPVGTYHYYVRDAVGCLSVVSNDIKIDPLPVLTVAIDKVNSKINCKGDSTGVIIATATGGLGNYVYTLLNGSGLPLTFTPTQVTPGNFTQLPQGSYMVHVDSGDCIVNSNRIDILEPNAVLDFTFSKTDVTCSGNGDGSITVNGFGGTGIIKYSISPRSDKFLDSGVFTNLKPGTYTVIIQDENGCYLLHDETILEPQPIIAQVDPASVQQEYCAGDKTGAFSVVISGGIAPYSTVLDDSNGTYVLNQVAFSGLTGGEHTVYIKDANTCTYELIVTLDTPVTLNPVANVNYDCVNDLPANKVTVTVDPSNNPADVTYSLDATGVEQVSNVFTNLTPGDHFIMAHHKNSCVDATVVFTIAQIDPLALSLDLGGLNEIVITATGGSGVYHYSVNGEDIGSSNKYLYFKTGDYTVTVTDSNGCSVTVTKYFEFIDIKIPNVFTPNGSGTNDTWEPTNTTNYPDIQFVVYDRYGREVGRFGAGQSWDGKYKGSELPMGDYWYVLKLRHAKDDREFIGHFTLYR
jgi:gliding motility-associated-like protein